MTDYTSFRQRLDAVLRTLDIKQVSDFLIAEKQWQTGQQPANTEYVMWMMIVGSPNLRDLHEQARQWLSSHGHEAEANMITGRGKGDEKKRSHVVISKKPKPKKPHQGK